MYKSKPVQRAAIDHALVEAQAKRIMDDFLVELGTIAQPKQFGAVQGSETRDAKTEETSARFRRAFFENATKIDPKKVTQDGEILMERKQW